MENRSERTYSTIKWSFRSAKKKDYSSGTEYAWIDLFTVPAARGIVIYVKRSYTLRSIRTESVALCNGASLLNFV